MVNGKEGSATARDVLQPSLGWDVEVVVVDGGGGTLRGRSQVTVTTETEEQYSVVYYVSTRARVQCR